MQRCQTLSDNMLTVVASFNLSGNLVRLNQWLYNYWKCATVITTLPDPGGRLNLFTYLCSSKCSPAFESFTQQLDCKQKLIFFLEDIKTLEAWPFGWQQAAYSSYG